jgi:hypothetical protein
MASNGDEVAIAIEDDDPFTDASAREGGGRGVANRRASLTKSKKFREARSMRFSELNQATGAVSLNSSFIILCIMPNNMMYSDDLNMRNTY